LSKRLLNLKMQPSRICTDLRTVWNLKRCLRRYKSCEVLTSTETISSTRWSHRTRVYERQRHNLSSHRMIMSY
jgi:hypothetical protein